MKIRYRKSVGFSMVIAFLGLASRPIWAGDIVGVIGKCGKTDVSCVNSALLDELGFEGQCEPMDSRCVGILLAKAFGYSDFVGNLVCVEGYGEYPLFNRKTAEFVGRPFLSKERCLAAIEHARGGIACGVPVFSSGGYKFLRVGNGNPLNRFSWPFSTFDECIAAIQIQKSGTVCAMAGSVTQGGRGFLPYRVVDGRQIPSGQDPEFPPGHTGMSRLEDCTQAVEKSSAGKICSWDKDFSTLRIFSIFHPEKPGYGDYPRISGCTKVTEALRLGP